MSMHILPNEILIKIFVCADVRDLRWLPLMLVCRRWRELAVFTPCFWQAAEARRNVDWFKLVLLRSADLPLDIFFGDSAAPECVGLLQPHLSRLRSLLYWENSQISVQLMNILSTSHMPILSYLTAHGPSSGWLDLSHERLPALRSLSLFNCAISWIPTMLPKLHRLVLSRCTCEDTSITFNQLLGIRLAECVELEELWLILIFSTLRPPTTDQYPSLSFPKLHSLRIWDVPNLLSCFLSCVQLPASAKVEITACVPDANADTATDAFLSLLPRDTSGLPLLRAATFGNIEAINSRCQLSGAFICCSSGRWIGSLTLQLGVEPSRTASWSSYLPSALGQFATVFAGAPLKFLSVDGEYSHASPFDGWVRVFTAFPTVERIHLYGTHAPLAAMSALGQSPYDSIGMDAPHMGGGAQANAAMNDSGEELEDRRVVLPNLRVVHMNRLDWCPGLMETMVIALQRRLASGLPKLERLTFSLRPQDEAGYRRAMRVYGRVLASLVENMEDKVYN